MGRQVNGALRRSLEENQIVGQLNVDGNIKHVRIRSMVEKLMCYNFVFHHVPAEKNQIVDCFRRLTREIQEAEHFNICDSILADHKAIEARIKTIRTSNKPPQEDDPWVEYLGKVAMSDPDYINIVHHIESGTEINDIDKECELSKLHNFMEKLSVITLKGGESLILKDNTQIMIPKKERKNILHLAHANNHRGYDGMIQQMRGKIWWEGMNGDARELIRTCEPCQRNAMTGQS